jgi:four helix bundle protein
MGEGTIKRFEDIKAWQKARELIRHVYELIKRDGFRRDYGLKEQLRRSATSIMLNISEGFCRDTDKDFRHFLFQARGSAAEV